MRSAALAGVRICVKSQRMNGARKTPSILRNTACSKKRSELPNGVKVWMPNRKVTGPQTKPPPTPSTASFNQFRSCVIKNQAEWPDFFGVSHAGSSIFADLGGILSRRNHCILGFQKVFYKPFFHHSKGN